MISYTALIVHLPLLNINYPANANIFFGSIISLTTFDVLPHETLNDFVFNFSKTDPLNDRFDVLDIFWILLLLPSYIWLLNLITLLFLKLHRKHGIFITLSSFYHRNYKYNETSTAIESVINVVINDVVGVKYCQNGLVKTFHARTSYLYSS